MTEDVKFQLHCQLVRQTSNEWDEYCKIVEEEKRRVAEGLPRDDVRRRIKEKAELIDGLRELTKLLDSVPCASELNESDLLQ